MLTKFRSQFGSKPKRPVKCSLAWLLAATSTLTLYAHASAAQPEQQKCLGSQPYNCYPQGDIDPTAHQLGYDYLYRAYADFAWQDFFALNFPAATDGNGMPLPKPSSTQGLNFNGGDYPTVWESFIEARDLFLPDGSKPAPFGSGQTIPPICQSLATQDEGGSPNYVVSRVTKAAPAAATGSEDVLDEYIQANRMGPVVDQNGIYLRFGINFNENMYNYAVVQNTLYSKDGQEKFVADGKTVEWPRGAFVAKGLFDADKVGAVMVKSAWKILKGNDQQSRFHRVKAYVYNPPNGPFGDDPTVKESCSIQTLGLVGFHIAHRSNSAPQWVWSTFEHVDNAPWLADFKQGTPQGKYSLFNPSDCKSVGGKPSCAYNGLPDHPWAPKPEGVLDTPTQVVRVGAPGKQAIAANKAVRDQLQQSYGPGGTVWENYFLVDVQFPTKLLPGDGVKLDVNPAYPDGLPTPSFLANSTIETYIQGFADGEVTSNGNAVPSMDQMRNVAGAQGGNVDPWNSDHVYGSSGGAQRNTSSCMACHGDAALRPGPSGGFVFSMSRAGSK